MKKVKLKSKIEDNTAAEVEILIHLPSGMSPDKTIDALLLSQIVKLYLL